MRFLLKILFAPILAALAVVTWFLVFVVGLSSGILMNNWHGKDTKKDWNSQENLKENG